MLVDLKKSGCIRYAVFMEVCMSAKPDFATMSKFELRAYVLEHRDDREALHAYLDKLHFEISA
jgi:quinol monooxygenase YgiN